MGVLQLGVCGSLAVWFGKFSGRGTLWGQGAVLPCASWAHTSMHKCVCTCRHSPGCIPVPRLVSGVGKPCLAWLYCCLGHRLPLHPQGKKARLRSTEPLACVASLSSCQLPAPQVRAASAAGTARPGLGPSSPLPCTQVAHSPRLRMVKPGESHQSARSLLPFWERRLTPREREATVSRG